MFPVSSLIDRTNLQLVATMPPGVKVVGLTVFKDWVILATENGVYRSDGKGPFEPIPFEQGAPHG